MLLANVLGLIFDNVPALVKQLGFIVYLLYNQMFEKALTVACNYLIIICVAAALYYHIRGLIAIHAENTALESQNSTSGEQSSNSGDISHGWGLKNMEKVCRHYGSDLIKGESDGVYTVKTALQIGSKED